MLAITAVVSVFILLFSCLVRCESGAVTELDVSGLQALRSPLPGELRPLLSIRRTGAHGFPPKGREALRPVDGIGRAWRPTVAKVDKRFRQDMVVHFLG